MDTGVVLRGAIPQMWPQPFGDVDPLDAVR